MANIWSPEWEGEVVTVSEIMDWIICPECGSEDVSMGIRDEEIVVWCRECGAEESD